jgi:S1-C subfamily serine protease
MLRKAIASLAAALLVVTAFASPASAEIRNLQESPPDQFTMAGVPSNFDLLNVAYAEFSDNPDFHYFFLDFASKVTAKQFNDGRGSWAMVMIDVNGDNEEDFRIETGEETLSGSLTSPATVWDVKLDREVKGCSAGFYTNLDTGVAWIGFRIPFNCLKLPRTVGIQGYSDFIADDDRQYDYAPDDNFFKITHRLATTTTPTGLAAPSVASETLYTVATPGSAPSDLVALSPEVLKSVVTVFCGQGLGTGWAAKVAIPAAVSQKGIKTFLVTNHHVIEDCLRSGEVTLTDVNGKSAVGFISSADEKNDLAGIYTTMALPTLSFRGERPQQGWWVGVLGTPRGLDGYLTTGIVSKVVQDGSEFGVSASLNPGNSGGPIFDRQGRVLGVATYKLIDSEGLGFARSTPLLCSIVVKCDSANPVWLTGLSSRPGQATPDQSAQARVKVSTLPAFSNRISKLTATQQNSINRLLVLNDWAAKFICTGVIAPNASSSDKSLARARAKAACDFALKRDPSLSTFYQTKVSTSRSAHGKVLVTLKD